MILDLTTKQLRIVLGEAQVTRPCQITTSWAVLGSPSTFGPGNTNGNTNGTTPVVAVAGPSVAGLSIDVHEVRVYNNDTVQHTVTLQLFDGTNAWVIGQPSVVAAGGSYTYTPGSSGGGAAGTVSLVATSGAGISGGPITSTGTLTVEWNAGTVTSLGTGLAIVAGALTPNWEAGTVTSLGSGITLAAGVLSAGGSGGTVTQVATSGAGISGGPITTTGTLTVEWNGGTVTALGNGLTIASNALNLILAGYLSGCTLAWVSNTTYSVAAGQVMSDDNTTMIIVSALTKSQSAWTAGNNNGSLDTGAIAATTWYHVFVIYNPTTATQDILLSLSASSPTLPSGYTKKRRVGSLLTDGSSHFVLFNQTGDRFDWAAPVSSVTGTFGNTTANTATAGVPTGVVVEAILSGYIFDTAATGQILYVSSLAQTDEAIAASFVTSVTPGAANTFGVISTRIVTNTSAQFRVRQQSTTLNMQINTNGWVDRRGTQ